jgi:hypothetical protein
MRTFDTIISLIFIIVFFVALATNPDKEEHMSAFKLEAKATARKEFPILGRISNALGITDAVINYSDLKYRNFFVFSVLLSANNQLISFGCFNKVYVRHI